MGTLNFDPQAEGVDPSQPLGAIPAGRYSFEITETEVKPTKKGDGEYLQLTCRVIVGDLAGRQVWARFNISNPSKQAEEIARRELAALMGACGIPRVGDSDELVGAQFDADVKIETNKENGNENNRITGYYATEGGNAAASAPKAASRPAATKPAANKAAPPWQKSRAA